MSTKPSAISAFLGEAAPSEASVKIEITGTPQSVQRAVAKMAKKPAGKKPGAAPKAEKPAAEEPEAPKAPEFDGEGDTEDKAADVVESLIKEGDKEEDELDEFTQYLKQCTNKQVQGVYDKEKKAGRRAEMRLAKAEAERRGIDLDL